ncbi:NAD-dependent protein deacylase [Alicyclobacillus tolerans]|uniref:protein acetyllysine N-acetyltransferase n=1 Tax=Alicyclobacillus tolerans TaxID=90970 RepID=A0A1M6V7D1_9BACL|nr:NAD-dependent protein deacylase [Alicyclobacillus montanus]SHK77370.1 NAD-dependent deacetylase [Alicyclobacillus montanus]
MDWQTAERMANGIARARRLVVLTGAGMSTESGIPDFRSASGLWSANHRMEKMSISYWKQNPDDFWAVFRETFLSPYFLQAKPHMGHYALASLEEGGRHGLVLLTQNVDGLHQLAGNRHVIELHGHLRTAHCPLCHTAYHMADLPRDETPYCTSLTLKGECGYPLRPDVVLFGDPVPDYTKAALLIEQADLLLVLGSSLLVEPVASLPFSRQASCPLYILNEESTPLDAEAEIVLHAKIGEVLPGLLAMV